MFDKDVFKKRLVEHVTDSKLECAGSWALASNVFVAKVRKEGDENWKYYFYYDMEELHFCNILDLLAVDQVIANDMDILSITENYHDKVRIVCFGERIVDEFHALGFARKIIAASKGHEIQWLAEPCHTYFF